MFQRPVQLMNCLVAAALCLVFAVAEATAAPPVRASEYEVKAAYIVNFLMFVGVPAGTATSAPPDTVAVAILGDDPFGKSFAPVEGHVVGRANRKLRIHRCKDLEMSVLERCRAVFIARSEESRLDSILEALRGRPLLTISDIDGFVERGGMIGLVVQRRNLVRWAINRKSLDEARLTPRAQLLRNAVRVVNHTGEGRGGKEGR